AAISISELHRRLNHVNHEDLRRMVKHNMVDGLNVDLSTTPEFCRTCMKSKIIWQSFSKESSRALIKSYGDKVVADLWGPAPKRSLGGKYYYMLLKD
ncbi:hypothetical protein BDN71DRAFT_1347558, partial [Pleurotus eryngii]